MVKRQLQIHLNKSINGYGFESRLGKNFSSFCLCAIYKNISIIIKYCFNPNNEKWNNL